MQNALIFIIGALFDLYVITFFFRLVLGWSRADFRNPLAQFVVKVTNPLVVPARRFITPIGKFDLATLLVLIVLQSLATWVLMRMACVGDPEALQVIGTGLLQLTALILRTWSLLLLIYVISSWVAQGGHNPAMAMLSGLVAPVLEPFRRFIPSIGGLDLSPVFALLLIQFLIMLIPGAVAMTGVVCAPF